MDEDAIAAYLRNLAESLRRAGRPTQPLVDEAAAPLHEDAARIAAREGCGDADAARRAVARFGAVEAVLRSVRRNGPLAAAQIARVATLMLFAALAWEIVECFRFHSREWLLPLEYLELALGVELVLVSVALWRALAVARVPAWLPAALRLQGAFALALFVAVSVETLRFAPYWTNVEPLRAAIRVVQPLWVSIVVQSAAGLRALSISRRGSISAA
jgi:hypothetical protein